MANNERRHLSGSCDVLTACPIHCYRALVKGITELCDQFFTENMTYSLLLGLEGFLFLRDSCQLFMFWENAFFSHSSCSMTTNQSANMTELFFPI